jgi:F-type H+-transporting ATPase subunit delta
MGKRIILSASVSPDIIGGVVIRIGDQLIDGSTRTKLMTLREALVEQRA